MAPLRGGGIGLAVDLYAAAGWITGRAPLKPLE
jgi:hypothetical protein